MDVVKARRRYLVMDEKWVGSNIGFLRWSCCLVVDEILNLATKAFAIDRLFLAPFWKLEKKPHSSNSHSSESNLTSAM